MTERRVWKYPLGLSVEPWVRMPVGAEVVHVAEQGGQPTLWAIVDSSQPMVRRLIHVVGTGDAVPDGTAYVGTAHLGGYVLHVFDGGDQE